jgi:hypothetical protein
MPYKHCSFLLLYGWLTAGLNLDDTGLRARSTSRPTLSLDRLRSASGRISQDMKESLL